MKNEILSSRDARSGRGLRWIIAGFVMMMLHSQGLTSPADTLTTGYNRGLNTDLWSGGLAVHRSVASAFDVDFRESFESSRLSLSGNHDKWKDQNVFSLSIARQLAEHFRILLLGRSSLYSDKQSGFENDIKTHTVGIGGQIRNSGFLAPVFLGMTEDTRFGQTDLGPSYSAGAEWSRFDIASIQNSFEASYREERLRRRKNNTLAVEYRLAREFYTDTNDSLSLSLHRFRRDYYVSDTGEIESRLEDEKRAENVLNYRFGSSVRCRFQGALGSRRLRIQLLDSPNRGLQRERRDFDVLGAASLHVSLPSFRGDIGFSYSSEEQEYTFSETSTGSPYSGSPYLIAPDNTSAYTTLALRAQWHIHASDSLILNTRLQRFRYDTPDPENYEDRDELRYRLNALLIHRFSPVLTAHVRLSAHLTHYVYIFGRRSADNNWTRILLFSPAVVWQVSPAVRWTHAATVLANYVDYDFESLFPSVRSFLYRKFQYETRASVDLRIDSSVHLTYRIELDENGKFLWDDWIEQKLIDRKSHTLAASYTYRPWKGVRFRAGYSVFLRRGYRFLFNPSLGRQREINTDFRNHGPSLRMDVYKNRLRCSVRVSTIATRTLTVHHTRLTRVDGTMSWNF